MKYYQSLFILFLLFTVVSCSGPKDELEQLISTSLRDNQGLSEEECDAIHELVLEHESLSEDYGQEKDLAKLIDQIASKMAERKSRPIDYPLPVNCFTPVSTEKVAYNIYLENSASMDGYYQGDTEFKVALYDLLTRINGNEESASLHFINQKIHPIQKDLKDFISYLSSSALAGLGDDRSNSKLDRILEMVVEKYRSDDKPAILVSDYIFSLKNNADLKSELDKVPYTIANTCQGLDKEKDAILVMQFSSAFNGIYYDMYNKRNELKGQQRPYYFWLIGPKTMIHSFIEKYGIERSEGYQDYLIIDQSVAEEAPYHAILPHTFKEGRFSICRDQEKASCIEDITFFDRKNPPVLKFAVAVDLINIPLKEEAKLNIEPFAVVSEKGNQISIASIQPISSLEKNDERYRGTATHIMVLQTESLYKGEQIVTIRMKKQIPSWVKNTNTDDDTGGAKDKTFGLEHLIDGVNLAFNPNDAFFFEIPITIRYN